MALAFGYGTAQLIALPCYDGASPTAPTNPVCTVSVDGGAFGAADNAPSVVGPVLFLTLSAAEMASAVVVLKVASDNLEDHYGGPYYPGGDYTAARAGYLDKLNVAGALALEATLTAIKGAGWSDETLVAIMAAIEAVDPGGDYVVTRRFIDGDGNAVSGLRITVQGDSGGDADSSIVCAKTTSASGYVTFNLDAGTYHLLSPSSLAYDASDTTVVVSANSSANITLTGFVAPSAPSGDYCTVFGFAESVGGVAGAGSARVSRVWSPATRGTGASTVDVTWSDSDAGTLDNNGYWYLYLLRGAVVDIEVDLTNGQQHKRTRVLVPDTDSVNWEAMVAQA